jgi:hypothetical protein
MTTSTEASVRMAVTVDAAVDRAFEVFTQVMTSWWPPEHHILASELVDTVVEPRPGGAMYDVGADGSTCQWGTVIAYEPPNRFAFQWNIDLQWQIELDHDAVGAPDGWALGLGRLGRYPATGSPD